MDRPPGRDAERRGAGGGPAVTDGAPAGPSGGAGVTSGWTPRRVAIAGNALWIALLAIQASVNAVSQAADKPDQPAWHFWCWEWTSFAGWLCVAPLLWRLVRWIPVLARRPLVLPAILAGAAVALSLVHVGVMFGLRPIVYLWFGEHYRPDGSWSGIFLYELRKDASTLLQMSVAFFAIQWLMPRAHYWSDPAGAAPEPQSMVVVEVQDGPTTHFVPLEEIDVATAAGNYVELSWRGRTLLHRTTLTALEEAWARHGFVRIHRGTLVRAAAIVRVETLKSGDFVAELAGERRLRGSRRYRAALDEAGAGLRTAA